MSSSPQTSSPPSPDDPPGGRCPVAAKLPAYLDNELPAEEAEAVTQHLEDCPTCQAVAEQACQSVAATSNDLLWFPEVADEAPGESPPGPPPSTLETDLDFVTVTGSTRPALPAPAPPLLAPAPPLLAGRFELRRTVGMGGCGTVYEAWDRQLRRVVAVKVPHWPLFEKPSVRQRFAREARAAARLSHPNVVPVHEACVGETGDCYLVSEFVPGPSLEEWLARQSGPVDVRHAARIVAETAAGVDAAHAAGVIHRDLKPSNVLLAPVDHGELPFVPRVTDFGIARLADEATATTTEGRVVGSLPYMSPEQATAAKDVGPSSDVYSLGAMLYELLTGQLPITAEMVPALLSAIPVQVVVPPRRKRPEVPADLEAVCLKCLEKRPKDRYRTAGELAVDLRRFLAGEPVSARLPGRWERLQRWARRNPTTASVLSTLAVAVLVVVGVLADANRKQSQYIQQLETADRERTTAITQLASANTLLETSNTQLTRALIDAGQSRRAAETQGRKLQENLYVSEFQQAMQAWESQDLALVERTLDRLDQPEFAPFRGIECDWLRTKLYRPRRELMKFPRAVYTVAFSGDGQVLAGAGRDAIVKLVRYADGTPIAEWETGQKEVNGLAFVDEDRKLWTSGDDGSLVQWDVATKRELVRVPGHAPEQAHDLLVVPQQNLLLSMGTDGRVLLWDPVTGESRGELAGDGKTAIAMELHPDGQHLYVAYRNRICRWNLTDKALVSEWPIAARPMSFRLTTDGSCVLYTTEIRELKIHNATTGELVGVCHLSDQIRQIIRSPYSNSIFGVDDRGTWHEFDLPTEASRSTASLKSRVVSRFFDGRTHQTLLTRDGRNVVATANDGAVFIWSAAALSPQTVHDLSIGEAHGVQMLPGERSVIFSDGRRLHRLDLDSLQQTVYCDVSPRSCHYFCVLPDGDVLTGETESEQQDWVVHRRGDNGQVIAELSMVDGGGFADIAVDPQLGIALLNKSLGDVPACRLVTIDPLNEMRPWQRKTISYPFAYSISGASLALKVQHSVAVFDMISRNVIWTTPVPGGFAALAVSPDGRYLACAGGDRIIRVWDARNGTPISELSGHQRPLECLVFSSDGRTLLSGDGGENELSEVRCWHVATGDLLGTVYPAVKSQVHKLILSQSNDRLLIHHDRNLLQIIPLKPSAVR